MTEQERLYNQKRLEQMINSKQLSDRPDQWHLPLGFPQIDRYLQISSGQILVISGETGCGKTSFAVQVVHHALQDKNYEVLLLSCQQSSITLVNKLIALETGIKLDTLKGRGVDPLDIDLVEKHRPKFEAWNLTVDDTTYRLDKIIKIINAFCGKAKLAGKKPVLILDDIQSVKIVADTASDTFSEPAKPIPIDQEISHVMRELRMLANRHNLVILAISQIIRVKDPKQFFPSGFTYGLQLSALRYSGSIENTADHVLFLYPYIENGYHEIDIAKSRNVQAKRGFYLKLDPAVGKFTDDGLFSDVNTSITDLPSMGRPPAEEASSIITYTSKSNNPGWKKASLDDFGSDESFEEPF